MAPIFTRDFQRTLLWILTIARPRYAYGASTLYGSAFNQNSAAVGWTYVSPNTTFPAPFGRDSVCPVPCSIAFTNGISVDFFSSAY